MLEVQIRWLWELNNDQPGNGDSHQVVDENLNGTQEVTAAVKHAKRISGGSSVAWIQDDSHPAIDTIFRT